MVVRGFPQASGTDDFAVVAATVRVVLVVPEMAGSNGFAVRSFVGYAKFNKKPWKVRTPSASPLVGM